MIYTENVRGKRMLKATDKLCNTRLDVLVINHYQKIQPLKKACSLDYTQSGIPP